VTDDGKFSLASAQHAANEGRLAEWVIDFLASPGSSNSALAAALALSGATYLDPIPFALDRLTPMAGPVGDEVVVPVAEGVWEHDVEAMEHSMEQGWHPPPLLVSYHDGRYFLEDGNHRYESLRRAGATHAWIVLLFAGEAERARYLKEHGSDLKAHGDRSTGASSTGLAETARVGADEGQRTSHPAPSDPTSMGDR
jgi:hypothetical protein